MRGTSKGEGKKSDVTLNVSGCRNGKETTRGGNAQREERKRHSGLNTIDGRGCVCLFWLVRRLCCDEDRRNDAEERRKKKKRKKREKESEQGEAEKRRKNLSS